MLIEVGNEMIDVNAIEALEYTARNERSEPFLDVWTRGGNHLRFRGAMIEKILEAMRQRKDNENKA